MTEDLWLTYTDPIEMVEFLRGSPTSEDSVTWWNTRWQFEEACKGPDRRVRLFACACCRRIWDQIPEQCNRDAVAAVEDCLDGRLPAQAVEAALAASSAVEWKEDGSGRRSEPGYWAVKYLGRGFYKMTAAASALLVASQVVFMADEVYGKEARYEFDVCYYAGAGVFLCPFRWPEPMPGVIEAERTTQAALLRCIFRNPFRPLPDPGAALLGRNNAAVVSLAKAAYDERDMPGGTLDQSRLAVLADKLEEAGCTDQAVLGHLREPDGVHVRGCWVLDHLLRKE